MSIREVTKFNNALETLEQVRAVNSLIQGMCTRMSASELSAQEAAGLYVLMEWQNQQMEKAEEILKTVYLNQEALVKAA